MVPKLLMIGMLVIFLTAGVSGVSASVSDSNSNSNDKAMNLSKAVPIWQQVNSNGFGDPQTGEVTALEVFNGYLYAGTYNPINPGPLYDGAQIFRSTDGVTWNPMTQPGFGNTHDIAPPAILDFVVFNNRIYASTGRGNASQIWRSLNGVIWAPMNVTGFSDPENVDVTALTVYDGMIYAGVTNQVTGAQIWRSYTGNNNEWTQVAPSTPGSAPATITGFAVFDFDGGLYAAVESEDTPAQIWRSYGSAWEIAVNDGFGDSNTSLTGGLAVFKGYLYIGAGSNAEGAQLWRTSDGVTWEQVINPGFGDSNNQQVESVYIFRNQLYAGVRNVVTGLELWHSTNGTSWKRANADGFGDNDNTGSNFSNATADFLGYLYVGTSNVVDGGELWRFKNNRQTFRSSGANDGWILESTESSNTGGTFNSAATTFYLGDNAQKKQYRSILSFSTKGLPDNAVITQVTLKVKKQGITGGGDPVTIFQGFMVDVKKGFFGPVAGLQKSDFQAGASKSFGPFNSVPARGWYRINLNPAKAYINKLASRSGLTQFRLRFKLDDNNDAVANDLSLFSGNAPTASRPQLIIEYYLP